MEIRGIFSVTDLSDIEKDTFAEYLQHSMNNPILEFVRYLMGDDYLKFIDILSGTTFKVPPSRILERDLECVRIYTYVKKRKFTESSFKDASKTFRKSMVVVKKAVLKVAKTLGVEDILEGDELNNYIIFSRGMESYYNKGKRIDGNGEIKNE